MLINKTQYFAWYLLVDLFASTNKSEMFSFQNHDVQTASIKQHPDKNKHKADIFQQ